MKIMANQCFNKIQWCKKKIQDVSNHVGHQVLSLYDSELVFSLVSWGKLFVHKKILIFQFLHHYNEMTERLWNLRIKQYQKNTIKCPFCKWWGAEELFYINWLKDVLQGHLFVSKNVKEWKLHLINSNPQLTHLHIREHGQSIHY